MVAITATHPDFDRSFPVELSRGEVLVIEEDDGAGHVDFRLAGSDDYLDGDDWAACRAVRS